VWILASISGRPELNPFQMIWTPMHRRMKAESRVTMMVPDLPIFCISFAALL
jgi:hypothetical protein